MQKIDRLDSFSAWLAQTSDDAPSVAVQDLDLRGMGRELMARGEWGHASRRASREVLLDRRRKGLETHPYFWAPFISEGLM